uniref:Uncharacterized protein n=1 Tax=Meloidogyne enterolobii TaxID=390850 RepID=A0A6V7UPM4_MELEN|nr:unnamed protein product [Meloidogyne enterolobii]
MNIYQKIYKLCLYVVTCRLCNAFFIIPKMPLYQCLYFLSHLLLVISVFLLFLMVKHNCQRGL